jgi:hypothetical protein
MLNLTPVIILMVFFIFIDKKNNSNKFIIKAYNHTTHRVRRILFPEIAVDDDSIDDDGISKTTIVSSFASHSLKLKESILELLSIRGQFVEATHNIPQFVQKLSTNDRVSTYLIYH